MVSKNQSKTCFLGDRPHPGELQITDYCLKLGNLPENAQILDVGCGDGKTVIYLRSLNYHSFGLDIRREMQNSIHLYSSPFIQGNWFHLPIVNNFFDAVIAECTFSIVKSLKDHMNEIYRIMRTGGVLLLNGLYSRNHEPQIILQQLNENCSLQFLKTQSEIKNLIKETGFHLTFLEDQSHILKSYTLQEKILLWDPDMFHISDTTNTNMQTDQKTDIFDLFINISKLKLGYYVAIAEKRKGRNDG